MIRFIRASLTPIERWTRPSGAVRQETEATGLTAGVQVDEPLVGAAPEPEGQVLQLLYEAAVHQHIQQESISSVTSQRG